ncbi:MAG: FAD-binding domain-containing protein [Kiritimatiellae bacterium]|nr:FAD-binding domain-containing protein [Kiritimatiellia bacterium]
MKELGNDPIPDFQTLGITEQLAAVHRRETDLTGGTSQAHQWLDSFLSGRGKNYSKELSSPTTAYTSCSRMSPYLAWGCISMKTLYQAMVRKRDEVRATPAKQRGNLISLASLKAFDARLHWHCHFIQKLETEPAIEFQCFHASCEALRRPGANHARLEAWMSAQTGYPFVDACMRALQTRGWINFRMRAMLVSFAAYDLWIDWRDLKTVLARQFIDYEPGIHYSQLQMQSGTTGINTLRMYNPIKQGADHDPQGSWIRHWIPELNHVPDEFIHTPWDAPLLNTGTYPQPIVDHKQAIAEAREKFKSLRQSSEHKDEAARVYQTHGSRKRPARKNTRTSTTPR